MCIRDRVHDGQKGENEGLDGADEELVERLPDGQADPREVGRDQGDDDRNHQNAREDVAEESEGKGDRLGDLFNDVDRGEGRIGLGVVLEVATDVYKRQASACDPRAGCRRK